MKTAPVHVDALKALGYTEAEARFLYLVATHSGYFVARQFLAFANAHWGERTTSFWNKLHTKKRARRERFPKSGVVCTGTDLSTNPTNSSVSRTHHR
jgi:hypothetical protein